MKHLLLLTAFIFSAAIISAQSKPVSYKFNGEQGVFTQNYGQVTDQQGNPVPDVLAKASMPGLDMYLTKTGVTYVMLKYAEDLTAKPHPVFGNEKKLKTTYSRVDVALTGATLTAEQLQLTSDAGWQSNYYLTADAKGQLDVSHFKDMAVQNVYPGIDWVWKFNATGNLEYEFVIHPGADASVIKMQYNYADITPLKNKLQISTRIGSITEGPLLANSGSNKVTVNYNLDATSKTISFAAGNYDHTKDLVIDPPLGLNWSAQFGGSFLNGLRGVTTAFVDNYTCMVGYTNSNNFPVFNNNNGNYMDSSYNGQTDAILIALDTFGFLKWSTYMGGAGNDFANDIVYTTYSDQIYVTGGAQSGFPILHGNTTATGQDIFVASFNNHLQLTYSSFYGGNGTDEGLKIINNSNVCYVVGYTTSTNATFPSVSYGGYYQTSVTGVEGILMELAISNFNTNIFQQATTRYGGNGDDYITCVSCDKATGNVVMGGYTTSTNLPLQTTSGAYSQTTSGGGTDGFIIKLKSNFSLIDATYYGGTGSDYITGVGTSDAGSCVFTGRTTSTNFPVHSMGGFEYYKPTLSDAAGDAFIVKCDSALALTWATYLGGSAADGGTAIAADANSNGDIYVTGFTFSNNFPTDTVGAVRFGNFNQYNNAGNADGFITVFNNLGIMEWSTYKGDSCYQYPYDIYNTGFGGRNHLYVVGEGLLACGESFPDTGQVHYNASSIGFAWGFVGPGIEGGGGGVTPQCSLTFTPTVLSQPCPGQCNGQASISVAGNKGPYNIIWSSGGTALANNNLCPVGSWVEVKDSIGCVTGGHIYFNPLKTTTNTNGITCFPATATVSAIASGGNGTLRYSWSTSPGVFSLDSASISVSDTGTYTVTVQDSRNCTVTATQTVSFNNYNPFGTIEIIQYPSCGNNGDGILTVTNPGIDDSFPNGSVVWTDIFNNILAVGDTFNGANGQTEYYAIDSAWCYNGVTSPYIYDITLGSATDMAQLNSTPPSTCISNDGQAYISYTYNQPSVYVYTANNYGYSASSIIDNMSSLITYQWSTGESSSYIYDAGIGDLSVTVSDGVCTTVLSTTNYISPPSAIFISDNAYCNGGTIYLNNASSQFGPSFTFQWAGTNTGVTGTGTNPIITGLPVDYYNVTVTDEGGCTTTVAGQIAQGVPVSASATTTNTLCATQGSLGSVTVTAANGLPPYTGTGTFNYPAGTYTFVVTDAGGCTDSTTATIQTGPQLFITVDSVAPAVCYNGTETVHVTATGGAQPYSGTGTFYEPVGTDIITVTDNNGCTASDTITVIPTVQGGHIMASNTYNPMVCFGDSTTLTITATGGSGTYTGTGVYHITAGTHYFTITDGVGCSVIDTVVVTQHARVNLNVISTQGITCQPGRAQASPSSGSGPYQYKWSNAPGLFTSNNYTSITDTGVYHVTVVDANACTASATGNMFYTNPTVDPMLTIEYPTCVDSDGLMFSGLPDSTTWWQSPDGTITPGNTLFNVYPNTDTDNNLASNFYVLYDSSHCYNGQVCTIQFTISIPVGIYNTDIFSLLPGSCDPNAIPAGQLGTYWGQATDQYNPYINALPNTNSAAGPFPPYITGQSSCPFALTPTFTLSPSANITYNWGNGLVSNGTGGIFSQLPAGSYTVTVTDGACQLTHTVIIPTDSIAAIYNASSPHCPSDSGGNIILYNISSLSGINNYTYLWSNGSTSSSLIHIAQGNYSVTITNSDSCTTTQSFTIQPIDSITVHDSLVQPAICNMQAIIHISASNSIGQLIDTGNYYSSPGTWFVQVIDSFCTIVHKIVVDSSISSSIVPHNSYAPILCYGDSTTLTITATGAHGAVTGAGTYRLAAGTYHFTLTDTAGCGAVDTVVITQPTKLTVTLNSIGITCSPGSVSALPNGGSPLYMFQWSTSPGNYGSNSSIVAADTATYSVTVQDENLCTATDSARVDFNNQPPNIDSVYYLQLSSCGLANGVAIIKAPDPSKISWLLPDGTSGFGDTIRNIPTYPTTGSLEYIIINDSSNCQSGNIIAVQYKLEMHHLEYDFRDVDPSGCNTHDGYVDVGNHYPFWNGVLPYLEVTVNNSTQDIFNIPVLNYPPVTYQWSNSVSYTMDGLDSTYYGNYYDTHQFNLNAGVYTVTITDGACQIVLSDTLVNSTPEVVANYTVTNPGCGLTSTGSIQLVSLTNNSNGNQQYVDTFAWSNNATTQSISNLTSGTYTVTITGPNACQVIDTFTINAPSSTLAITNTITPIACYNGNATVTISATGGTLPYTGTGTFTEPAGNHVLTVSDAGGCSVNDSIVVPPSRATSALVVNDNVTPILCHSGTTTVTVSASGGISPYTGTGTYSKPAGTYVFTVTDSLGCSVTDTQTINQPGILYVTNVVNPVLCYGGNATISLVCHGGTSPYTGTGTFIRPAGNYVFTITDANNCPATDTVAITQPTPFVVTDTVTSNALCFGGTGTVHVTATGGTQPYYNTGNIIETAGNHLLVITDQNGCADSLYATITQPTAVDVTIQWLDTIQHCKDTAKIAITATGGNGPYTGTGTVAYTHNGTYNIQVTDAHGCTVDTTLSLHFDTCVSVENVAEDFGITIYPNPAADRFFVKFASPLNQPADVRLYAVDGKLIQLKTLNPGTDQCEINCNQLASGVYVLRTVIQNKEYNFKVVIER